MGLLPPSTGLPAAKGNGGGEGPPPLWTGASLLTLARPQALLHLTVARWVQGLPSRDASSRPLKGSPGPLCSPWGPPHLAGWEAFSPLLWVSVKCTTARPLLGPLDFPTSSSAPLPLRLGHTDHRTLPAHVKTPGCWPPPQDCPTGQITASLVPPLHEGWVLDGAKPGGREMVDLCVTWLGHGAQAQGHISPCCRTRTSSLERGWRGGLRVLDLVVGLTRPQDGERQTGPGPAGLLQHTVLSAQRLHRPEVDLAQSPRAWLGYTNVGRE